MSFFARFVDHPVQAVVVGLVVLLLGAQAIARLNVRQYPETTSGTITVVTPYIGASAATVRGFITTPLEQAIATADGIDYLTSSSAQGTSVITADLVLGADPDTVVAQILTRVREVANRLPESAENSVVTVSTGGDDASMYLAFRSDVLSPAEVSDYLNRAVRPRIETEQGIERAQVFGAESIAMRIWLDPRRMAALGIAASEVREVLERNNFLSALGETENAALTVPLDADTNLESVEAFERLVVRDDDDALVRLEDIATVRLGAESYDSSVVFDGEPAVFVGVSATPEANLLDAVARVREVLPEIRERLPAGIEMTLVHDATVAIRSSIDEVVSSLIEALAIVTFVIFLFLGSLRAALVPGVAMPLAIVGAFFLMQLLGYTINLLTLLALILAIGTVVDDGIVMVENASRHVEDGATADEAAKRTVRELAGSIVAMNLVVLAVFAPIGFMGGLTGQLFTEFAYTVAGATLISGVVALFLSPMMCARLLRARERDDAGGSDAGDGGDGGSGADDGRGWKARALHRARAPSRWVNAGFEKTSSGYDTMLGHALDHRWIVLGVGALALASLYPLFASAQRELEPPEDGGFLIVTANGDPNVSIGQLERWTSRLLDEILAKDPVEHAFFVNGGGRPGSGASEAFGGIPLKDWSEREQSQQALQPVMQGIAARSAGLQAVVISPPSLPGGGGGPPVQFVIGAIEEPRAVLENSQAILAAAKESGLFAFVDSDLKFDRLQGTLEIDRERAAALGVDIARLGGDLSTMLSAGYVNFFTYDGRSYRVVPQVDPDFRLRPEQLNTFYVAAGNGAGDGTGDGTGDGGGSGAGGGLVPLDAFASLEESVQPRRLLRFDQLNSATISGVPAPGVSIGEIVEFLEARADELLPASYVTDWAGQTRQFVDESSSLLTAFALAIALMYLVLVAQYESFRDPLVMLVSVPMSLAGALAFFALGVVSINIYTQIGLLALAGSIIRHGILLVEFANDIQEEDGLERREAMQKAAALRLRSILMTTLATIVGLIPLLVASGGPGAASRFAISFTLGVGMLIGTVFTLFVVPALYTVIASRRGAGDADERATDAGRGAADASASGAGTTVLARYDVPYAGAAPPGTGR